MPQLCQVFFLKAKNHKKIMLNFGKLSKILKDQLFLFSHIVSQHQNAVFMTMTSCN
jgi:hypothetical protein